MLYLLEIYQIITYWSKVHGGLGVHCGHWDSSSGCLAMVQIVVSLGNLVPLNPFCAVFLGDSHLNSVFVDALDHSTVSFQRSTSDCDWLANFEVLIFSSKVGFWAHPHVSFSNPIKIFGNNIAVISFFDGQPTSFIKFRIEQKEIVPVYMFHLASNTLNYKIFT